MNYYMQWFAAVVVVSFFTALFARSLSMSRPNGLYSDPLPNPIGFLIPVAAFTIFSGLRINIGDTGSYVYSYRLAVESGAGAKTPTIRIAGDSMFNVLQDFLIARTDEPYALIMITAILSLVPVIYVLYKYCAPYELGIALFVLTGYYSFSMNGIRQYVAAGLLIMGARYMLSDKKTDFFKFLFLVFLAWTFHTSALIMIPVYFIARRRAWTPLTLALLAGTVVLTLAFNAILPSFLNALEDTQYESYAENGWFTSGSEKGSNIIRVFVLLVPLVFAYLWRVRMSAMMGRKWDILVNISVLNLAFYILSLYNWIFARLAVYTSVYVIIMMTHLISKGTSPENRSNWYVSMIGLYIVYFVFIGYSINGYESELF